MYTPTPPHTYVVYMIFLRVMKIPDSAMPAWLAPAEATRIRVAQQE